MTSIFGGNYRPETVRASLIDFFPAFPPDGGCVILPSIQLFKSRDGKNQNKGKEIRSSKDKDGGKEVLEQSVMFGNPGGGPGGTGGSPFGGPPGSGGGPTSSRAKRIMGRLKRGERFGKISRNTSFLALTGTPSNAPSRHWHSGHSAVR